MSSADPLVPPRAPSIDRNAIAIDLSGVHKTFGAFKALSDVSLTVRRGERIVICGPSGSGKSTLIRCVNQLERHQQGKIVVDGIELTGDRKHMLAVRRQVGMVFQQFNLFPHLTVIENCMLAPAGSRRSAAPRRARWR